MVPFTLNFINLAGVNVTQLLQWCPMPPATACLVIEVLAILSNPPNHHAPALLALLHLPAAGSLL